MVQARRFGKRLVVPSTVEIIHELKLLMGAEAVQEQTRRDAAAAKLAAEQQPSAAVAS